MITVIKTSLLVCLIAAAVSGQMTREFEVASVKPTVLPHGLPINPGELGISITPTSVSLKNVTLRAIISQAFRVTDVQVVGPDALRDTFTIVAKLPQGATPEQVPEMLQDLLYKRFGFEGHQEKRLAKAGELSLENPDALRKQLVIGEARRPHPPKELERPVLMIVPLSSLARLSDILGLPVLTDRLPKDEEKYLFWLDTVDGPVSISDSLKKCGIRLTFAKVDVSYVVVDRINRVPTEN